MLIASLSPYKPFLVLTISHVMSIFIQLSLLGAMS